MVTHKTLLECRNLSIGYHHKTQNELIAQSINLQLKAGTFVGLVGVNGVGKSTFLRTITKMQQPLGGSILLNNIPLQTIPTHILSTQIACVFTEKLPESQLTVYDIVTLGRQPYTNWVGKLSTDDIKKINWAIRQTNIEDILQKKHDEISDGQLQKVMIARALAQDTPIIILDEPTTHLDLYHKIAILKLLKKLAHTTQKCILISTHDIDLAIQMCDEMMVMTFDNIYLDKPQNLIEKNIFDEVFSSEHIFFDKTKGTFIVR